MSKRTQQETYDSLNGFDEIAIRQTFRTPIGMLVDPQQGDPTLRDRALMFVELRRAGMSDSEAHERAMSAPRGEVVEFFADPAQAGEGVTEADPTTLELPTEPPHSS